MSSRLGEKADQLRSRVGLSYDHLIAFRFAINVGLSTFIIWTVLRHLHDTNPIWAIASMVAASDPEPKEARHMFKSRLINVLVGCVIGLIFLLIGGAREVLLPLAMAVTVLVSSIVVRVKVMWRQAPITAAVVIAAGVIHGSARTGISYGIHKVGEVIFGCLVGVIVSIIMSKFWLIKKK